MLKLFAIIICYLGNYLLTEHLTNIWQNYYLFISSLFNDTVSSLDYIASNARMINELERIWKKTAVA
jgi:hypothetical protein